MASKNKNLAELLDANGDVLLSNLDNISVDATSVSDSDNTSTGQFTLPAGTTAQRPVTSYTGAQRFNTDSGVMEYYDGTDWFKISAATATLDTVTGTIYAGIASSLTLEGEGFLTANLVVNFTQSSDAIDVDVTVTPTSDTSATVTVPSSVYSNVTSGNAVTITVTNSDGMTSGDVTTTASALPTGGIKINPTGTTFTHIFTSNSTFTVPTGLSLSNVEYLVVAGGGGGGGGWRAGGGGAGGLKSSVTGDASGGGTSAQSKLTMTAGTYTINVGTGGSGNIGAGQGSDGGTSSIIQDSGSTTLVTTTGGGGGGTYPSTAGRSGGSGGGAGGGGSQSGGSGTSGQGYRGGNGNTSQNGAGGGGAGAVGQDCGSSGTSGDGGNGVITTIISSSDATTYSVGEVVGSDVYFAGGGGSGGYEVSANNFPIGGLGGGADGNWTSSSGSAVDGADASHPNSGGGGAGSGGNASTGDGGDGADGVVIIRYTL